MSLLGPLVNKLQTPQQGQKNTSDPQTNPQPGGGGATAGQVAALQAKVAEYEARIRNLEGMVGHLVATVTRLQAQMAGR